MDDVVFVSCLPIVFIHLFECKTYERYFWWEENSSVLKQRRERKKQQPKHRVIIKNQKWHKSSNIYIVSRAHGKWHVHCFFSFSLLKRFTHLSEMTTEEKNCSNFNKICKSVMFFSICHHTYSRNWNLLNKRNFNFVFFIHSFDGGSLEKFV